MLRNIYKRLPFKRQMFDVVRRTARVPHRVYRHLHFQGIIELPIDGLHRFKIHHHGFQVENDLFWAGFGNGWEGTSLKLWVKLASRAQTIFDIGANTGVYALTAKAMNPSSRVYAFEPVARVNAKLKSNIALNGFDIETIEAGVSNRTGEARFFDTASDHVYSASLNEDMLNGRLDRVETIINVMRTDDFMKSRGMVHVDLVKIDTERHECEVFEGFGTFLSSCRPAILVEILDRAMGLKIEQLLSGLDLRYYEIIESHCIRRVDKLGVGERNYLICDAKTGAAHGLCDEMAHDAL